MARRKRGNRRGVFVESENVYQRHLDAMTLYVKRRIFVHLWDKLREDFERDYSRGFLSDNEHDDLLNRWLGATEGWPS